MSAGAPGAAPTVTRRGLGAAALALSAGLVLAGCGPSTKKQRARGEAYTAAARRVPGVRAATLTVEGRAEFRSVIIGAVEIDASDREALLRVFDEVMKQIVTLASKDKDAKYDELQQIEGRSRVGVVTVKDIDPDLVVGDWKVRPSQLYERYGIRG